MAAHRLDKHTLLKAYDSLSKTDRAIIDESVKDVIYGIRQRARRAAMFGKLHALELLAALGRWLVENQRITDDNG